MYIAPEKLANCGFARRLRFGGSACTQCKVPRDPSGRRKCTWVKIEAWCNNQASDYTSYQTSNMHQIRRLSIVSDIEKRLYPWFVTVRQQMGSSILSPRWFPAKVATGCVLNELQLGAHTTPP